MQEAHDCIVTKGGHRVIVRGFGGRPLVRRVLSRAQTVSFVCRDEHYDEIVAGVRPRPMVGFPYSDVFDFDAAASDVLLRQWKATGSTTPDQWERLAHISVPVSRG
jgi:hypothetical protein